jgi:hypothetical protein
LRGTDHRPTVGRILRFSDYNTDNYHYGHENEQRCNTSKYNPGNGASRNSSVKKKEEEMLNINPHTHLYFLTMAPPEMFL